MSVSIFNLPPEILFEIVQYSRAQTATASPDYHSLAQWALVCKTLLPFVQSVFFRHVILHDLRQFRSFRATIRGPPGTKVGGSFLSQRVRVLEVRLRNFSGMSAIHMHDFVQLLPWLPNLRQLCLSLMLWRSMEPLSLPFLRQAGTSITSLTISDVSGGQQKTIHQILARLPHLTHLAYIDKHHMSTPFPRRVHREICPARLFHLSFTALVRNNDMALWLLSNSANTLQSLEFGNKVVDHMTLAQILADVKDSLRSLVLPTFDVCPSISPSSDYSLPRCSQSRLATQNLFIQALQKCTALEDIAIGVDGRFGLHSAISLLQCGSPTIRSITVYGDINFDHLCIVMNNVLQADGNSLVSLRRLTFVDQRPIPPGYNQDQERAWIEECAALNIDLTITWGSKRRWCFVDPDESGASLLSVGILGMPVKD